MTRRQKRERDLVQRYTGDFAQHELVHTEWGRISTFVIRRPDDSFFYTEIYVGGGHLTVQGDIELISFAGGYQQHPQRLTWAAGSGLDYLWKKARIGSGKNHEAWETDVARDDILSQRRSRGINAREARAAWNILRRTGSALDATHAAMGIDGDCELTFGSCVDSSVILAAVAVRTLVRLLDEKKEWPPSFAAINAELASAPGKEQSA